MRHKIGLNEDTGRQILTLYKLNEHCLNYENLSIITKDCKRSLSGTVFFSDPKK